MRYSRPGDIVDAWFEGEDASGYAVVIDTSRAKASIERSAAERLLALALLRDLGWPDAADPDRGFPFGLNQAVEKLLPLLENERVDTWRSVTEWEVVSGHGCGNACEPGAWCADGQGLAWMRVITFETSAARARLEAAVAAMAHTRLG